jgi:ligand-binding sensor domain-containing protein/signal transduction histidine kinase
MEHWPKRDAWRLVDLLTLVDQSASTQLFFCLFIAISSTAGAAVPEARLDPVVRRLPMIEGKGIRFTRLSTEDGLSQTRVAQIVQDDLGFMWFGTQYGLNRYDGYSFKAFVHDPQRSKSFGGAFVYSLFKDRSGILWIGNKQTLDRFDPTTETFTHYLLESRDPQGSSAPIVVHISQDRAGMLWLATGVGLYRLDPLGGQIKHYRHNPSDSSSLNTNDVKWTGEDRAGTLWVGTDQGLDAFDRATGRVTLHIPVEDGVQTSFYEDRFGVFWILHGSGSGLAVFDRKTNRLTRYSFYEKEPPAGALTGVMGIIEDREGNLWLGSPGAGLLRFDRAGQRFVRYRNNPGDLASLAEDKVICLFKDREGNIWTGLHSKGPNHFNTTPPRFETFRHEPGNPNSPGADFVNAIYQDHEGILWIGTDDALNRVDRKTGEYTRFAGGVGNKPMIIAINEDSSGNLWAGTFGHGLNRFDRRTGKFTTYLHNPADPSSLSNDEVHRLFVDHTGTLWVATDDGLDRFDPATGSFKIYKVDPRSRRSQAYASIAEDRHGMLWLGSGYSGLHRFNPATGQFVVYKANPTDSRSLQDNAVPSILLDGSNALWVGTENGLERFDFTTSSFTRYDTRDGLAGNDVGCLLEDSLGGLWISTNRGLSNFDPIKKIFKNYSAADGLPGNDLTGWSTCSKNSSGEMFFAGFSGAVAFDPEKLQDKSYTPDLVLTDFRLSGVPVTVGAGSPLTKSISYTNRLTLSHGQPAFSLTFSALSYSNPASNRYRYKLEGLDEAWHEVGSDERLAAYTTLPAGSYTFHVQGATSRGAWSEPGAALEIEILPAFWSTLWFRTTFIAIVLLAGWWFYRVRMLQIVSQLNLRLDERLRERIRIARDLHDTLLQSFQGLVLQFQAVHDLLPASPIKAKESLGAAIDGAAEAIAEGRDAIQELRSGRNSSDDLVDAVTALGEEFRLKFADAKPGVGAVDFDVVVEGTPRDIYSILRDDLYRITREAVGNAFRHARPGKIEVEINYDDRMLRLRIRDNGIGIDPKLLARGARDGHWGLPGMRERAKGIGGQFEVWSEVNKGTEVEVTIPGAIAYRASDDDLPDSMRG